MVPIKRLIEWGISMDKKKIAASLMLTAFATNSIVVGVEVLNGANEELTLIKTEVSRVALNIYDEIDKFLMQQLVHSRYQTATTVVWVYGCSDKS